MSGVGVEGRVEFAPACAKMIEKEKSSQADIQACLLFAAQSLSSTSFMPLAVETA